MVELVCVINYNGRGLLWVTSISDICDMVVVFIEGTVIGESNCFVFLDEVERFGVDVGIIDVLCS